MLLEEKRPKEAGCSRRWLGCLAGGLLVLGALAGGVGLKAAAPPDRRPEMKKAQPKVTRGELRPFDLVPLDRLDDETANRLRREMEQFRKQMEESRKRMEQALKEGRAIEGLPGLLEGTWGVPRRKALAGLRHEGRLGARVSPPSETLVDQLGLPKGQGVVLDEVLPGSAAAKAGLKAHDVLLEVDGKAVPARVEDLAKTVAELKADTPFDVVVLRKGKRETVKGLSLPKASAARPERGLPALPRLKAGLLPDGVEKSATTSISRTDDRFTAKHSDGETTITVRGAMDDGKAKAEEIVIEQGKGRSHTYSSVDEVPAEHREKVRGLVEMSRDGRVRFPDR